MKRSSIATAASVLLLAAGMLACGGGSGSSPMPTPTPTPTQTQAKWASVKYGGGGYVPGLIFHPTSPDLLYARTDMGGAYRWNAATSAWVPITDGFGAAETFYHGSESMALDPNDDKRVYMSTGMYLSDKADARLYISTDRGDNWTYGTRTTGLWKSADRGQTWQQVSSLSSTRMTQAQISAVLWSGVVGVEQVIFDTSTKGTGSATQTLGAHHMRDVVARHGGGDAGPNSANNF